MDTFECIRTRRTTRAFLRKDIPGDALRKILEAGRLTPSAGTADRVSCPRPSHVRSAPRSSQPGPPSPPRRRR